MTPRTKVSRWLYEDSKTGSFFIRPVLNGRRTWRRVPAANIEEATEKVRPRAVNTSTVRELVERYIKAGTPRLRGRERLAAKQELANLTRVTAYFGDRAPGELSTAACIGYSASRPDAPRAAECELQSLSNACNWGVQHGFLTANPVRVRYRVQTAEDVRHARETMPADADELHAIAAEMLRHPQSQASGWQMIFEAFTGLRTSEALSLRMDARSKLDPGWIEGDYLYIRRAKSGQFPFIPLHPALSTAIQWHREWHAGRSKWWFPGRDLVRPQFRTTLTVRLADVCRRLKIPHRTSHGMRAYFVTVMRSQGKRDEEVAALIGDRSVSLIRSTYGELPEVWAGGEPLDFMPRNREPAWRPPCS